MKSQDFNLVEVSAHWLLTFQKMEELEKMKESYLNQSEDEMKMDYLQAMENPDDEAQPTNRVSKAERKARMN